MWPRSRRKKKEEDDEKGSHGNGEYRRGKFLVKDKDRIKQLLEHDEKARVVYDGVETQIDRLKRITERIKRKKECKCTDTGEVDRHAGSLQDDGEGGR